MNESPDFVAPGRVTQGVTQRRLLADGRGAVARLRRIQRIECMFYWDTRELLSETLSGAKVAEARGLSFRLLFR